MRMPSFKLDDLVLGIIVQHGPIDETKLYGLLLKLKQLSERNEGPHVLQNLWVSELDSGPYCPLAHKFLSEGRDRLFEFGRSLTGQGPAIAATTEGRIEARSLAADAIEKQRESLEAWIEIAGRLLQGRPVDENVRELALSR